VASSTLVGLSVVVGAAAGSSSVLPGAAAALSCSEVCAAAPSAALAGSPVPWPAAWLGSTSDAALKEQKCKS